MFSSHVWSSIVVHTWTHSSVTAHRTLFCFIYINVCSDDGTVVWMKKRSTRKYKSIVITIRPYRTLETWYPPTTTTTHYCCYVGTTTIKQVQFIIILVMVATCVSYRVVSLNNCTMCDISRMGPPIQAQTGSPVMWIRFPQHWSVSRRIIMERIK